MTSQPDLFPAPAPPPGPSKARILENAVDSPLWSQIETALFETMNPSICDIPMGELKEMIRENQLGVLIVMGGDLLNGVALLDGDAVGWLDMSFVWSEGLETLNNLLDGAESIARATDMRGVKWVLADERGQGYAKRRGYKRRLVEYVKEV